MYRGDAADKISGMRKETLTAALRNPEELILIFRIAGFLTALPMRLKRKGIEELVEAITPRASRPVKSPLTLDRIEYLCQRILRIFQRHRYDYSCLKRSLLLYHFLRYYRVPVSICFGVRWAGENLTGHSWLVLDGEPYLEPEGKPGQFTHFFTLPREAGAGEASEDHPSLEDIPFD